VRLSSAGAKVSLPRDGPLRTTLPPRPSPATTGDALGVRRFGGQTRRAAIQLRRHAAPSRPWVLSWIAWSVLMIAAGGAGAALGVLSRNDGAQARTTMFGDSSYALEQRANNEAIGADACLAAAGAFGIPR